MNHLEIITVVNDFDCFDKTIKNNHFMNKHNLNIFDNNKENVGISKRYNSFIEDEVLTGKIKDSWLVFCHQDFAFLEDPLEKLKDQNKRFIYGPNGAAKKLKLSNSFKRIVPIKYKRKSLGNIYQGFQSSKYFSLNNKYFKNHDSMEFMWGGVKLYKFTDELFFNHKKQKELKNPETVDTLDCCCFIAHSSLFTDYNLKFDERFTFHLYSEDFSLNAKYNHNIETKAMQFKCFHRGEGDTNKLFFDDLEYLKDKYKGKRFVGTCFNCDW